MSEYFYQLSLHCVTLRFSDNSNRNLFVDRIELMSNFLITTIEKVLHCRYELPY